jgi:predicted DCC family thiol-disulfide oxidoreductase YuxK
MTNGKSKWTGGQYSLFRAVFGVYLFVHFAQLVPWGIELFSNRGVLPDASTSPLIALFPNILAVWDGPVFVTILLILSCGLSMLFALGAYDRVASLGLWYMWACFFGRNPLIANPSLPYIGWLLLAHACLPPAPYGSWAGSNRLDPADSSNTNSSWHMSQGVYLAAWTIMALGYSYSGFTKLISPSWIDGTALARVLDNPLARPGVVREMLLALPDSLLRLATWGALGLELSFAPLALIRRLRPWLWSTMLLMHIGLIVVIDFADLSLGMVMFHLFTFDPAWIHPRQATATGQLFYDGHCGLCHRAVRFVLAEDQSGDAFRFAPLDSETFRNAVPECERTALPDSLVILTADGALLTRAAAILYILQRLGGMWQVLGSIVGIIPALISDTIYDGIARIRHRLFSTPAQACPLVPPGLRERFDV